MTRVFSGIQPTGQKHIGNYLGAIRHYVADQERYGAEAIFCVVDLHSMTQPFEPAELTTSTRDTFATLVASGLDPERAIVFVQSHVHEHAELAWLFNCVATMGEVERMVAFKEKSAGPRVRLRRAPHLPRAAGGRHPPLPRRPRARGRGPAAAPGARARHRAALQLALRRALPAAAGRDPADRRAHQRPAGARAQDVHLVDVERGRQAADAGRARRDPPQVQARRDRLGQRDPARLGDEARRLEPARDPAGRDRRADSGARGALRGQGLRPPQDRHRRGRDRAPDADPRAARGADGRHGRARPPDGARRLARASDRRAGAGRGEGPHGPAARRLRAIASRER